MAAANAAAISLALLNSCSISNLDASGANRLISCLSVSPTTKLITVATTTMELPNSKSRGGKVYVPENLYVIGTMNVADRSLALVDLAAARSLTTGGGQFGQAVPLLETDPSHAANPRIHAPFLLRLAESLHMKSQWVKNHVPNTSTEKLALAAIEEKAMNSSPEQAMGLLPARYPLDNTGAGAMVKCSVGKDPCQATDPFGIFELPRRCRQLESRRRHQ